MLSLSLPVCPIHRSELSDILLRLRVGGFFFLCVMGRSRSCIYMLVLCITSKTAVWILLKLFAGGEFSVRDSQLFLLLLCTSAVQLVRGVFNLDISLIRWFGDIGVLFCIFWSHHSWRSWWRGKQKCLEITTVDVESLLNACWTCPWDLTVSLMELFTGNKHSFWLWEFSPQVLDYQDVWIIRCWIKGILLHL